LNKQKSDDDVMMMMTNWYHLRLHLWRRSKILRNGYSWLKLCTGLTFKHRCRQNFLAIFNVASWISTGNSLLR